MYSATHLVSCDLHKKNSWQWDIRLKQEVRKYVYILYCVTRKTSIYQIADKQPAADLDSPLDSNLMSPIALKHHKLIRRRRQITVKGLV